MAIYKKFIKKIYKTKINTTTENWSKEISNKFTKEEMVKNILKNHAHLTTI